MTTAPLCEGILLVDKPKGKTSFDLVRILRKRLGVQKIGHGGTLDPFATGVLVMLVGRAYTKQAALFLADDKEYQATLHLGMATDTYDCEGAVMSTSNHIPSLAEVQEVMTFFQGSITQQAPMFSAKKVAGQRLYERARKGELCDRPLSIVQVCTTLIRYAYPELEMHVICSKGTYIRALGHDIGQRLGCAAYVKALKRVRSGNFQISSCLSYERILDAQFNLVSQLQK
jgi:tRNA pseudouridine55 synthase